ncbi:MAG: 4a-hydroxytetrahydrobiopterin dehydratase [Bacteroidota bacterium]
MNWKEENNQLQATFKFDNFTQAWAFMTEVAFAAEGAQHHPNWSNVYNTVEIALTTHDAGNTVTQKDRDLASKIDEIYSRHEA